MKSCCAIARASRFGCQSSGLYSAQLSSTRPLIELTSCATQRTLLVFVLKLLCSQHRRNRAAACWVAYCSPPNDVNKQWQVIAVIEWQGIAFKAGLTSHPRNVLLASQRK